MLVLQINDLGGWKNSRDDGDKPGIDQNLRQLDRDIRRLEPLELEQNCLLRAGIEEQAVVPPADKDFLPVGVKIRNAQCLFGRLEYPLDPFFRVGGQRGNIRQEIRQTFNPEIRRPRHAHEPVGHEFSAVRRQKGNEVSFANDRAQPRFQFRRPRSKRLRKFPAQKGVLSRGVGVKPAGDMLMKKFSVILIASGDPDPPGMPVSPFLVGQKPRAALAQMQVGSRNLPHYCI